MSAFEWRKSSRCHANNGCVEAARLDADAFGIRDSTDPYGSRFLLLSRSRFAAFLDRIKADR